MRIFLTGGTGFIGSHFLRETTAAGHEVRALRRSKSRPRVDLKSEPEWVEGSLGSVSSDAFANCEVLVHLAAAGVDGNGSWEDCFRENVDHSLRLWMKAIDAGVSRFVICGSCFEYGRAGERYKFIPVDAPLEPTGAYHASKAAASMAALGLAVDRNISVTILRPFHVYGEGEKSERFWPSLQLAALGGRDLPMTQGEQVRDFIEVDRVARRFLRSCSVDFAPKPGKAVIKNIGSGRPQTLRKFSEYWWKKLGATGKLLLGAIPYRKNEVMRYVPDVEIEENE